MSFNLVIVLLLGFVSFLQGKSEESGHRPAYYAYSQPIPGRPEYPSELNSTKCGEVLVANGGFITYKLDQNYINNERCIWTLRTAKWQTNLMVLEEGFHSENDRLDVYTVNGNGLLEHQARITKSTGSTIIGVIGPTVFLVFSSDQTGTGKGFLLKYFAFGYGETTGYYYDHYHFSATTGSLSWPSKPLEHHMNIFSTIVLQPFSAKDSLVLSVNKVDLISLIHGCDYNYFSVHQLFEDGFQVRLRYCQADLLTTARISTSSPLVITYAATMGPQQTGIEFSWS